MQLEKFEENNLQTFETLKSISEEVKELNIKEKELKDNLKQAMEEHEIKKIDNDFVTVTYVAESETVKVDWKEVQMEEPDYYKELLSEFKKESIDDKRFENEEPAEHKDLMNDYPKVSKRKAHIRMKVKSI